MATLFAVVLTTLFFAALGPLVGGLPLNLLIFLIPMSYVIGTLPAVVAGLIFSVALILGRGRIRTRPALLLCGGLAGFATMVIVAALIYRGFSLAELANEAVTARVRAAGNANAFFRLGVSALVWTYDVFPCRCCGNLGRGCVWLVAAATTCESVGTEEIA